MMRYLIKTLVLAVLLMLCAIPLYADDLEIFNASSVTLKPNVLIVYDNSGSMGGDTDCYDDDTGLTTRKEKITCARDALKDLVSSITTVNFGLMSFNRDQGGKIVLPCGEHTVTEMYAAIDDIHDNYGTYTPLAETLAEAGLYFNAETSWYSADLYDATDNWYANDKYVSPQECDWQQNFIVVMTDGEPYNDEDNADESGALGDETYVDSTFTIKNPIRYDNDSSMDEIAYFLNHTKGITTHTIGFDIDIAVLEDTAAAGGGTYSTTTPDPTTGSSTSLKASFQNILTKIQSEINSIYATPAIPRNPQNKSESGNDAYMAFFRTQLNGRWLGNLKGYGLSGAQLLDNRSTAATPLAATGTDDVIKSTAQSYWPLTATLEDGLEVLKGGVGDRLKTNVSRAVYTFSSVDPINYKYTGAKPADPLATPDNAFEFYGNPQNEFKVQANPQLTYSHFNVSNDVQEVRKVLANTLFKDPTDTPNFTKDLLSKDQDGQDVAWKMGDIIHSEPFVESYKQTDGTYKNYLFVGANDGMLHVFDTTDGAEAWAFVPPGQLGRLKFLLPENNTSQDHYYFVDGSPVVEEIDSQKVLAFGEGRGGDRYYALQVTDPLEPWWVYQVTGDILGGGSAQLGQAWATPQLKKVKAGGVIHDVFLLAGGYDERYEDGIPSAPIKGRAVYTVNAATGQQVGLNINGSNWLNGVQSIMTHSIVEVAGVDAERRGYMDRVYAGDLGGNVFAAKYDEDDDLWERTVLMSLPSTLVRKDELGNTTDDGSGGYVTDTLGKKILTRPAITLRGEGECIYFGTGDREHLTDKNYTDAFYSVCNVWEKKLDSSTPPQPVIVNGEQVYVSLFDTNEDGVIDGSDDPLNDIIKDVTENLVQTSSDASTRTSLATQLKNGPGWFMRLPNDGEKVTSSPVIRDGKVIFTTFEPGPTTPSAVVSCEATFNPGTSRLYVVDYKTGAAVIDFDEDGSYERSTVIGKSVAYSPIITTKGLKNTLWTGSGGGLGGSTLDVETDIMRYYWRQVK